MEANVTCRLVVQVGDHPGMIYPLRTGPVTVGRGPESTIQIIDTRISRNHARLELKNGAWTVLDLKSKNGTTVNDNPIAATVQLVNGDTVQFGDTTFAFETEVLPEARRDGDGSGITYLREELELTTSRVYELPEDDAESDISGYQKVPEDADARLKSIIQVGKLIQTILDLDELLNKVMATVVQVLQPTYACILLQDEQLGILVPKVIHRPPGSSQDLVISGTVIHQAIEEKSGVLMEDSRLDDRFKASESIVVQRITSAICVALISKGEVLGAMYLDVRERSRRFSSGDLEWAAGVASQAALGIAVAMSHSEVVVEQQRRRELEIARQIQMNLLPKSMPEVEGFDFGGLSEPARMVGGDYFDVTQLPDGDVALAIADVSGKGVPAAIMVASVRAAVRIESRSLAEDGILEVMSRLNETIVIESMSNMFVTMVLCYFEPEMRRLTYCNAGHVHPIFRNGEGEIEVLEAGGCFLGIMPGIDLETGSVRMEPGSLLFMISDGVTDAVDPSGEAFGFERVLEFVKENHALPAQEMCEKLQASVTAFQDTAEQFDDLTVLAVRAV